VASVGVRPWLSVSVVVLLAAGGGVLSSLTSPSLHQRTPSKAVRARLSANPFLQPIGCVSRAGFAGYRTEVSKVKDVAASWRVPAILKGGDSHYSDAATWIGIENPKGYFMQIGTLEHATVPDVFGAAARYIHLRGLLQ
jgi:hypothetical protein